MREYVRTQRIRGGRFLTRRMLKIWPQYYVYLGVFAILHIILHHEWNTGLWRNLLHVQNYLGSPLGQTWSLSVEEHFYLILAGVLTLWAAKSKALTFTQCAWVTGLICVGSLALRLLTVTQYGFDHLQTLQTHLRLDGLAFGVLLAAAYHLKPELFASLAKQKIALALTTIVFLTPVFAITQPTWQIVCVNYTCLYIAFGSLLLLLMGTPKENPAVSGWIGRAVAFVGVYSYGIYLWHQQATQGLIGKIGSDHPGIARELLCWVLYIGLAIASGVVMTLLVEWPFLKYRDRKLPSAVADTEPRLGPQAEELRLEQQGATSTP